jgi:hypothetical protein
MKTRAAAEVAMTEPSVKSALADFLLWAGLCVLSVLGFVLLATHRPRWALVVLIVIVAVGGWDLWQASA